MAGFKSFKDLDCWKECVSIRKKIRDCYNTFPPDEKYLLVDQLKRASRSVTANIAEGFGRYHYLENLKYCRMSRGSLTEINDHLITAREENYITDKQLEEFTRDIDACLRILNGYMRFLRNSKSVEEKRLSKK
jgi:four helix bundle protein